MAAGPAGPQGPGGPADPTMPAPPPGGGGGYYAPPHEREPFERGGHPGYPPGYGYDRGGSDPAAQAAAFARRHLRTPETKEFFKTSEFMVWALTAILLWVAAATSDAFDGGRMWGYLSGVSAAYIISRGLAKAGTRRGDPESHHDRDLRT